jgi:hypothetical protein
MSQEAVARPYLQHLDQSPKPTFAALDKAICEAADSVDLTDALRAVANEALKNQLFLSPRLSRWQLGISDKGVRGYSLRNSRETATVTVSEDRVILTCPDPEHPKHPYNYEIMNGLPAATLYKSIQDAQAIVQSRTPNGLGMVIDTAGDDSDEFFNSGDESYIESAGLDAALEDTHAEPLVEDDAELIEEVTVEQALNEDQRRADGEEPVVTVSQKFIEDITEQKPEGFTTQANRKNASTDGVQCPYCGNLNQSAFKDEGGTFVRCPQCPKLTVKKVDPAKGTVSETYVTGRFKSLQGRILNIVEASFADKTQREAVKTLINKEFRREITKVGDGE